MTRQASGLLMTAYAYADRRRFQRDRRRAALVFVTPLMILWGLFLILPILEAAWYSLTDWDGLDSTWNGGHNYVTLLHSADFGSVVFNNVLLLLSVPVAVAVPFCIALLIAAEPPGWRWARALIFLPATLSWVITGIVWLRFFAGNGILNGLLQAAGLGALQMDMLGDVHTAIIPIALTFIWSQVGPNTLIFLIGFGNIDPHVLEAATIDGAGLWRSVWHIVLPLMTRIFVFVTIITLIAAFTALFSLIFVMTGGGPGFSTTTMEFYIYRLAFSETNFGMGAAVGVVLLFVIACVSLPLMTLYRRTAAS